MVERDGNGGQSIVWKSADSHPKERALDVLHFAIAMVEQQTEILPRGQVVVLGTVDVDDGPNPFPSLRLPPHTR